MAVIDFSECSAAALKAQKSGQTAFKSGLKSPQSISAVYDSTIGSQEAIVERAKQVCAYVHSVKVYPCVATYSF